MTPFRAITITILTDTEQPGAAVSGHNGCALPGAAITGGAYRLPPFQSQNLTERRDTPGADWRSDATGFYD